MHIKTSFLSAFCLALLMTAGCGSTVPAKAPEFGGEWTPLNQFEDGIQVMPLRTRYHYGALPIDVSLVQMLQRWAKDSGVTLDQRCDNDFSLPSQLLALRAPSLHAGLTALNGVYRDKKLQLSINRTNGAIVMRCATESPQPPAPSLPAPSPETVVPPGRPPGAV